MNPFGVERNGVQNELEIRLNIIELLWERKKQNNQNILLAILLCDIRLTKRMGYRSLDRESDGQIDIQTLYAEITEIRTDTITVEGLQLNGTDYCSEFTFQLHEGLMIECNDTQISVSDLNEGDFVSSILLTDLGGIEDVFKIYLIRD